jgi:hypothetical protein
MRKVVSELSGIGGAKSVGFGENRVRSLPDAVAKVLAKHYEFKVNGKVEDKAMVAAVKAVPQLDVLIVHPNASAEIYQELSKEAATIEGRDERAIFIAAIVARVVFAGILLYSDCVQDFQVLLFYKYVSVTDPAALADAIRTQAAERRLTGRAIVAEEGVNATLEGSIEATESFALWILSDTRFADMQIKRSRGEGTSFPGLSVKVRNEIVGTGFSKEDANPAVRTAPRLSADALRSWYETEKEFTVIDMRNNYEYASGHFKNSGVIICRFRSLEILYSCNSCHLCIRG